MGDPRTVRWRARIQLNNEYKFVNISLRVLETFILANTTIIMQFKLQHANMTSYLKLVFFFSLNGLNAAWLRQKLQKNYLNLKSSSAISVRMVYTNI